MFNWLFARHHGGTFVLRIEDTDTARNSQAAIDVILQGMRWLGLDWDEGPATPDPDGPSRGDRGPYFQSRRGEWYRRRIEELRDRGLAYDRDGAVYFRMSREAVVIPDMIVGDVRRELTDREQVDPDWVLVRSDGQPVFHLVNVVDDLEMGITHVIRGEDHLSNTAKHIALFRAFGVEPPRYAHIPLILNPDGSKMSKRDKGAVVTNYMEDGYAPEAVVNYLSLLGWSPSDGKEWLSVAELVGRFDLDRVNRSPARFDERKLAALHFEHARAMEPGRFAALGREYLGRAGVALGGYEDAYVAAALMTAREKGLLFKDLAAFVGFYFKSDGELEVPAEVQAKALGEVQRRQLGVLRSAYARLDEGLFTATGLEAELKRVAGELGVKAGALTQPARAACTGSLVGPSLYHLMEVLGRGRVLARMGRWAEGAGTAGGELA